MKKNFVNSDTGLAN